MTQSDRSSDTSKIIPAVRRRPAGVPDPVDIHVGSRVRLRRTLLGLSQEKLGEAIGLTFQQVQKYERGANRIGASRMYDLSQVLSVAVSYFYEDMPDEVKNRQIGVSVSPDRNVKKDPLARRETLELVRAYYKIGQPAVRKRIFELIKSVAKIGEM